MAISASLQALISGETIAGSKLSDRLLIELMNEGLLHVITRGSRKSYRARDIEALKRYFIDKDESYHILEIDVSDSRASMAAETGNSKLVMVRSCPGFPINSYEPIMCSLNGKEFVVNPQEGSFVFVTDWINFTIPGDIIVVGIENMENFRMIRQQKPFIEEYLCKHELPQRVLFASRYPQSSDLRKWLSAIPNKYIHFGDFDLAGIQIFLSEFQKYLGTERASFLIPDDISSRLKHGSFKRYDEQYPQFKDVKSDMQELQQLIDLINKEHKGYDQEGYINPTWK